MIYTAADFDEEKNSEVFSFLGLFGGGIILILG
jgi:hypothetical protein